MTDRKMMDVEDVSYLCKGCRCSMDPGETSKSTGIAFKAVLEFMTQNAFADVGKPLAVYQTHDETVVTFQAGFIVPTQAT